MIVDSRGRVQISSGVGEYYRLSRRKVDSLHRSEKDDCAN